MTYNYEDYYNNSCLSLIDKIAVDSYSIKQYIDDRQGNKFTMMYLLPVAIKFNRYDFVEAVFDALDVPKDNMSLNERICYYHLLNGDHGE